MRIEDPSFEAALGLCPGCTGRGHDRRCATTYVWRIALARFDGVVPLWDCPENARRTLDKRNGLYFGVVDSQE